MLPGGTSQEEKVKLHLQVLHGIPIVLQEDDCVGRSQVQAQAADCCCEQHDGDGGIAVEPLHDAKSGRGLNAAGTTQFLDGTVLQF